MPASAYTTILQQFYLAYFGRPADPVGLNTAAASLAAAGAPTTLAGLLSSANPTVVALINGFGSSAESTALFTGTTTARVTAIYVNVLNRNPDVGGLLFWSQEIDSGRLSLARVALAVIEAAARDTAGDGPVVAAKTNVAISYTASLDTVAEINAYNGNAAAASARTLLSTVVATTTTAGFQASVDTNIANLVANNGGAAVGTTFTLATGADSLTGTTSNDTFISINAVDDVTVTALTGAAALTGLTLTGGGTQTITTGALVVTANTVIDGSAATGVLTINAAAATANPLSIIGGSKADVITTSALNAPGGDLVNGGGGLDDITITAGSNGTVQTVAILAADADRATGFVSATNKFDYNGVLANGTGVAPTITAASEVLTNATTFTAALSDSAAASNIIVFIAQGDIAAGAGGTALTTLATAALTAANISAFVTALVGTGGALNGSITNLDTVLGTTDSVLLALDNGTHSAVLRITNTDVAAINTLTAAEIQVVGVFNATAALAAADFI